MGELTSKLVARLTRAACATNPVAVPCADMTIAVGVDSVCWHMRLASGATTVSNARAAGVRLLLENHSDFKVEEYERIQPPDHYHRRKVEVLVWLPGARRASRRACDAACACRRRPSVRPLDRGSR